MGGWVWEKPWELGGFPPPQGGRAEANTPLVPKEGQPATGDFCQLENMNIYGLD